MFTQIYSLLRGFWYRLQRWGRFLKSIPERGLFFSAYGEDKFISEFFNGTKDGFYADIGSGDPILDSNTYFFYRKLNWKGIVVDPIKSNYLLHRLVRPRDTSFKAAIGIKNEKTLYVYPATEFSTTNQKRIKTLSNLTMIPSKIQTVKCLPLKNLFVGIDNICMMAAFMSVDVEGDEQDVLESGDWIHFRPYILIIEDIENSNSSQAKFLSGLNYSFIGRLTYSNVYKQGSKTHNYCGPRAVCRLQVEHKLAN